MAPELTLGWALLGILRFSWTDRESPAFLPKGQGKSSFPSQGPAFLPKVNVAECGIAPEPALGLGFAWDPEIHSPGLAGNVQLSFPKPLLVSWAWLQSSWALCCWNLVGIPRFIHLHWQGEFTFPSHSPGKVQLSFPKASAVWWALELCPGRRWSHHPWRGFTKPGGGTRCQGLVDEEVLSHRLDFIISKVFSKLAHSGML